MLNVTPNKPLLAALAFAALAACSTAPGTDSNAGAYWLDQKWDTQLFHAIQSAVHYPVDAAGLPIGQAVTAHGKVAFTYIEGKVVDPKMMESTGRPDLDAAMLQQVSAALVPVAFGLRAKDPHIFALKLDMPTPWDHFRKDMFAAIHASMFYPKEAISEGAQGQVVVAFDYFDGKASNFSVADSSGDRFLDAAALRAFERANLPGPLPQFGGRLMHFNMGICYSLGSSTICSTTRDVLEIVNTPPAQTP